MNALELFNQELKNKSKVSSAQFLSPEASVVCLMVLSFVHYFVFLLLISSLLFQLFHVHLNLSHFRLEKPPTKLAYRHTQIGMCSIWIVTFQRHANESRSILGDVAWHFGLNEIANFFVSFFFVLFCLCAIVFVWFTFIYVPNGCKNATIDYCIFLLLASRF